MNSKLGYDKHSFLALVIKKYSNSKLKKTLGFVHSIVVYTGIYRLGYLCSTEALEAL